jgi:hypothetical protein
MTKDEALQQALDALTDFDYDKRMSAIESIKEALETKNEYERGFIDGMQNQMQSSVDKAVNAMTRPTYHIPSKDQREWVELTKDEVFEIANFCKGQDIFALAKELGRKLKEKNT